MSGYLMADIFVGMNTVCVNPSACESDVYRYYPPPFILSLWERRHGNINNFFLFGTPNH